MKKINFIMAASLAACAVSAQAQEVIAKVGFEPSDQKYTTEWALTPDLGTYGDWVNVKAGEDEWNEQNGDAHSGEYCLRANNSEATGYTWDRGFKVGNLKLKDNTSYRVSFWVKAESSYIDANSTEQNTAIKSSISIGREYFDNELISPSGQSYNYNFTNGVMTGDWTRISYVTFNTNKALLDEKAQSRYGEGGVTIPATETSEEIVLYPAGATDIKFPDNYFVIINMYNPTEYMLDDICVEEGVAFNAATFYPSYATIKLDFGYPTNIANLAKASNGTFSLDPSCVKVMVDGQEVAADYVEGKADGFLYIFFEDENVLARAENVTVSFTPAADCPIMYNTDKRPSADVEGDMMVLGFTQEIAYSSDEDIDVMPSAWSAPVMISTNPENNSFELDAKTLNNISITFDQNIDVAYAAASLVRNGKTTDLNDAISADGATLNIAVSNLADGDYTLIVSGVANTKGFTLDEDIEIKFSVGEDADTEESVSVYSTNETFAATANGTFPVGWVSNDNGTIHQYGIFNEETGAVVDYNWGGNTGGGGCRAMSGYSGDFNGAAIYWRSMNGDNKLGTLTFGEQVKDFILSDGTIDPEMDPRVGLYLEARKYQISFRMAAWKNLNGNTEAVSPDNAPKYTFTLEDLEGNVYAEFKDKIAMPNVNGAQNMAVTGCDKEAVDFAVEQSGYYMIKCSTTQPNGEYLLGGVDIITMPSKAAYYKQQLAEAVASVEDVKVAAEATDYDGETKTAFLAALKSAEEDHFTAPSQVEKAIADLKAAANKLQTRVQNIDDFGTSIIEVQMAMETVEGKYANAQIIKDAQAIVADYADVNPSTLSDEKLAEVTPIVKNAAAQIGKVQTYVDILTWGASKAGQAAQALGADALNAFDLVSDDREAIAAVNANTTIALYDKIVNGEDLTGYMTKVYDPTITHEENEEGDDENGHPLLFQGIDLSGFVQNTHLYRVLGDAGVPGWTITAPEADIEGGKALNIAFNGEPNETDQVVDAMINIYGDAQYDMSQTVEGLPAGKYAVVMQTRTPLITKTFDGDPEVYTFYYNAQNEETNEWDKYVYAQGDADDAKSVAPYMGGGSGQLQNSIAYATVKDGQLTLGAVEHYVSGLARAHEDNEPRDFWTGTSQLDYVNIYFISPLDDFDYAKAKQDIIDAIDAPAAQTAATATAIYTVGGAKVAGLQKGINIVKMSNGTVKKVFVK